MGVADGLERLERAESRRRKWNQKVGGGTGETRCGPDGLEFRSPPPPFTSSKPGWKVGEAEPARLYPGTEAGRHRLGSDVEDSQPGSTQEREAEPRRGSFCTGKAEPRMEGEKLRLGRVCEGGDWASVCFTAWPGTPLPALQDRPGTSADSKLRCRGNPGACRV